ncbi:MAG TPA: hypothetical protein VNG12_05640 [Acidimicrobiales bacterium]|nr:hypothetical protein [Acidimicrobiales bacterium]
MIEALAGSVSLRRPQAVVWKPAITVVLGDATSTVAVMQSPGESDHRVVHLQLRRRRDLATIALPPTEGSTERSYHGPRGRATTWPAVSGGEGRP